MRKEISSNWPYIFWFLFCFMLFWMIAGATPKGFLNVSIIYTASILFALSPMAESLWRMISGIRALEINSETYRLQPLFDEVYAEAQKRDKNLPGNIKLYIKDDMDINAFAFGRSTLVLTRGSIEMLSDECLKGLIAHEFGHFSHYDTSVILIAYVGNMLMSLLLKCIRGITKMLLFISRSKDPIFGTCFKILYNIVNGIYRGIIFIGDIILMSVSREHEFMADKFAQTCGYGNELADVLNQIHQVSMYRPESVIEQLRSTHLPLTQRIARLENLNGE